MSLTKLRVVSLVKEQLVSYLLNDNVPRVVRPGAAHQSSQDGISGVHVTLCLGQLADDGVISGGHCVEDSLIGHQGLLVLAVDTVVRLVVELDRTTRVPEEESVIS